MMNIHSNRLGSLAIWGILLLFIGLFFRYFLPEESEDEMDARFLRGAHESYSTMFELEKRGYMEDAWREGLDALRLMLFPDNDALTEDEIKDLKQLQKRCIQHLSTYIEDSEYLTREATRLLIYQAVGHRNDMWRHANADDYETAWSFGLEVIEKCKKLLIHGDLTIDEMDEIRDLEKQCIKHLASYLEPLKFNEENISLDALRTAGSER